MWPVARRPAGSPGPPVNEKTLAEDQKIKSLLTI
jgi:hypothetical protein